MPKTIGDFFSQLITKGGGDATNEAFKNFFSNGELVKIEIPDEIAKQIDNGLISIKDAKNNHTDIKNHYTKQALDGIDKSLEDLMNELELDEATKNQILVERSTYKKPAALIKAVKDLELKKAAAAAPDKAAFNKQLEELHAQIRAEKSNAETAKKDYEKALKDFKTDIKLGSLYASHKTVLDSLDPEAKSTAIKVLINKHLQDNNAQITLDENGNPALTKKDGTNYFGDNNQVVTPQQFVDQVLSRNKLLVTTQQAPPANGGPNNGGANNNNGHNQQPPPGGSANNGNTNTGSATLKDIMAGINKDLETSQNVPIFGNGN